jgi:hypothetical protein
MAGETNVWSVNFINLIVINVKINSAKSWDTIAVNEYV